MCASRPVIVMQAPERLYESEASAFRQELKNLLRGERPRIVLDCSGIKHIDSSGVEMLLLCMDEAMKRDGDVKLAAVAPGSAVILELMKVDRLFEVFDSAEEAVRSFHGFPLHEIPQPQPWMEETGELKAAS
jgi:anti-sigma B factor antagonist